MEFFETLGSLVSRRWKEKNYNEESFPEVAGQALSDLPPALHVSMWDIVRWATTADQLPRQDDIEAKFGNPPLSVYTGRNFRIEVLFWVQGLPAIHQHGFSGAFHVMHGSSIHSLWQFEVERQVETRLLLGRVSFERSEVLFKGDSRSIFAGNRMFHSTYHLDRPSISVVIRTLGEANKQPQYSLLPPTIAHAPLDEIATVRRQKQLMQMLLLAGKRTELNELMRYMVGAKDAYSVFEFLRSVYHCMEDEEDRQNILSNARLKHADLIDALQPALLKEEEGNRILRLHRAVGSAELKFFLALLRNIPERKEIFRLIAQRFPERDPVVTIVNWMRKLSEEGEAAVSFAEPWLLMLEYLLRGCSHHDIADAFARRYGSEHAANAAGLRELCSALTKSWLLRSLCLSNPFESQVVALQADIAPARTEVESEAAHGELTVSPQVCGHESQAALEQGSEVVAYTYRCLLDAQPSPLVPHASWQASESGKAESWTVNPSFRFSPKGKCPDPHIAFADAVTASEPTAWVSDPITSIVNPFVLGAVATPIASVLRAGGEVTENVAAELLFQMSEAGLIYESASIEAKRKEWRDSLRDAKSKFRDGYAALGSLLHPFTLGATRAHFRQIIQHGKPRYGDTQTPRRWNAHNEPVARFLHHQLTPIVEEIAGTPIKASYVYFASYHQGAKLPRHVDREQCEISLSMLIDYYPDLEAESPWPLWLDTRDGAVAIYQRLGDTLIYRGRELPHYRHELPSGHVSTHLFFHYVLADFTGSLD